MKGDGATALDIVIVGLTITSSWGNGHATTYRALVKGLAARGHRVAFLERDRSWYRDHRDVADFPYCETHLYQSLNELSRGFERRIATADLVILGSYVPDGVAVAGWITTCARGVTAFYDIDTPVTLAALASGANGYLAAPLIPRFDLYLSFTGGPTLELIEGRYGSPRARPLYCSVDPELHCPLDVARTWDLGYLGTYSADRQPALDQLMLAPARRMPAQRMVVAGSQYPPEIDWPPNVGRIEHLHPHRHAAFYCGQRFTLSVTRAEMVCAGYSPSVRLFEAAACGVPIVSDRWSGLETFFAPGRDILVAERPEQVIAILSELSEERRRDIAAAARKRVLSTHTGEDRAKTLEGYYGEVIESRAASRAVGAVA